MKDCQKFPQPKYRAIDEEKVKKIAQKISDAEKYGTFLVDDINFRELNVLSRKLSVPIFYIYPINDSKIAIEIKCAGVSRGDLKMSSILVEELSQAGVLEGLDARNFDAIGNSATVIAVLLQENSRVKRNYPILVHNSLLHKPYYTQSGELVQLSEKDFMSTDKGLLVSIKNSNTETQQLDKNITRQYIKQNGVIQIATTLTTKRFKESGFSYTYLNIYYLGRECRIAKSRGKFLAQILMKYDGEPVKNNTLATELMKRGINFSMDDAKDGWRMESPNFSRQLSAAKSEANSGIRRIIKETITEYHGQNVNILDFVKTMNGKNQHYFDNNGF